MPVPRCHVRCLTVFVLLFYLDLPDDDDTRDIDEESRRFIEESVSENSKKNASKTFTEFRNPLVPIPYASHLDPQ